jgi:adenylylsulfate kinase
MAEAAAKGFALWLTGPSGSGLPALAEAVATKLRAGGRKVELLAGEEVRAQLCRGLAATADGGDASDRRLGWVAHLLVRNGIAVVVVPASPRRAIRDENRALIGDFVEVLVDGPPAAAAEPYEPPARPEVVVKPADEPVDPCVAKIVAALQAKGYA